MNVFKKKHGKETIRFLALSALFFYVLCWFTDQQSKTLWYIGIALPWLSFILSIPIHLFAKKNDAGIYWAYTYVILTIIYVVAASLMLESIWNQIPHLAACVTFIAYFALEHHSKS